jgi:hypothetical protein
MREMADTTNDTPTPLLGGFAPLAVAGLLAILIVLLVPSVAPEQIVPVTTTQPAPQVTAPSTTAPPAATTTTAAATP